MTVSEKIAYLKGLADGSLTDKDSKEGKLFAAVIDILEDVADELSELGEDVDSLGEEVEEVSEDLCQLEEFIFGDDDDDDDDDDYDCDCGCCSHDDDEPIFFELKCPACENEITIDEDVLELGVISCPNCGESLEFDFDEDDEDDDEGDED